jgi:hypothetical protein
MTPRDYIGKTFKVIRADDLRLGDEMFAYRLQDGMYHSYMVTSLELVGDDVVINTHGTGEITTSIGNAVLIEVEE